MRKKTALVLAAALAAMSLSGCVKVIDTGTEGEYTGEVAFDAAAHSGSDWETISAEITEKAADLSELLKGDGVGKVAAVSGTATIDSLESKANGKKNALIIKVDGYDDGEVKIQTGSIYSGTDVRDIQTLKNFEDFTNQTEWSEYGKALNSMIDEQIIAPLALDESVAGKTVTFVGAASQNGDTITITPVSLTIE